MRVVSYSIGLGVEGGKGGLGLVGAEGREKGRERWREEGVVWLEERIGVAISRWANMPALDIEDICSG